MYMSLKTLSVVILVFLMGFITAHILSLGPLFVEARAPEQYSPSDWINESQIHVYSDKVLINVSGAEWAKFADTNSMDPFLDKGANALQLKPTSAEEIHLGDVISYHRFNPKTLEEEHIIHRVVFKGEDEDGVYFVAKGDNNPVSDPGKIRFEDIDRVLFAIIY